MNVDETSDCRVVFNEITKDAIKKSFKNPRKINNDLVDAQQARRILDRLVGYNISPLLWKKIKKGLSAGRVQSVAVKMIIDRENEINQFKPEEYWSIAAEFMKGKETFNGKFYGIDGKKTDLGNEEDVKKVLDQLTDETFTIEKVNKREEKKPGKTIYYFNPAARGCQKAEFQGKKDNDDSPAAI